MAAQTNNSRSEYLSKNGSHWAKLPTTSFQEPNCWTLTESSGKLSLSWLVVFWIISAPDEKTGSQIWSPVSIWIFVSISFMAKNKKIKTYEITFFRTSTESENFFKSFKTKATFAGLSIWRVKSTNTSQISVCLIDISNRGTLNWEKIWRKSTIVNSRGENLTSKENW